jgi:predicted 2-oxoglutarate/Fe(II)-dependent dioxygenase YbiX
MQLKHSSIIYNHQQSPPMYIYASHIDHNIQQFPQIHQVTYSIMTQFINQSIPNVKSMYSSNTLIINNHHSHATIKTHAKMICAYTRTYMHVVPNLLKVVTSWCNKNIIVNGYNQRLYNIRHDIWCMNIWLNQPCICSQQFNGYNQRLYVYTCIHCQSYPN